MTALQEAASAVLRRMAQHIETQSRMYVGTPYDVAVTQTWTGNVLTVTCVPVLHGGTPPESCTLYLTSQMPRTAGGAA